jgi:uncharacterized protein
VRAVVDTNVFVSAAIRPATVPAQILLHWRDRAFDLILYPDLLSELRAVLYRPSLRSYVRWSQLEIEELLAALPTRAIWIVPTLRISVISRDPDDNRVLEAAVSGQADYVVTSDRDLLDLGKHGGIKIVSPRDFLAVLDSMS